MINEFWSFSESSSTGLSRTLMICSEKHWMVTNKAIRECSPFDKRDQMRPCGNWRSQRLGTSHPPEIRWKSESNKRWTKPSQRVDCPPTRWEIWDLRVYCPRNSDRKTWIEESHEGLIPHTLTVDQKLIRIDDYHNNLLLYRRHPCPLKRTLAIDESWVSLCIHESKSQAKVWKGSREKVPTTSRAELK